MKRTRMVRVGGKMLTLIDDIKKDVGRGKSRTDLTDDLALTIKQSGIDKQLKRLMRRRYT